MDLSRLVSLDLPEAAATVGATKNEDAALTHIASLTEACLSILGRRRHHRPLRPATLAAKDDAVGLSVTAEAQTVA
jgi:hypothetical protein